MAQYGPGDKPAVVRKRARRNRKPPTPAQVQRATQGAAPLSSKPVRPKRVVSQKRARQTQRQAQNARPLSSKPIRPKQVVRPLAQKPPRRVTVAEPPEGPRDVRQVQRQAAVHIYDQMSRRQKQARVREAQRKIKSGKADASDRAVAHIHTTRVQGTKKIAAAQKAMEALGAPKPRDVAFPPKKETSREATNRLATAILNPSSVAGAIKAIGAASAQGYKNIHAPKVVQNIPKDIAEIAVTTPSSIAKLATTTATHPKKVPGMLAAPYKEIAREAIHGKGLSGKTKFIQEHPVSTALMFAPAARLPGRAVGRVARAAGKQTLERPAATLPHTTLKEARSGSRGAVSRAVQARRDVKRGAPTMTQAQVQRRVDEFYDFSKQQVQRTAVSAAKEAKRRGMTKEAAAEHVSGAKGGARDHQVKRMFAKEFGTPTHIGHIDHPDAPKPGSRAQAEFAQRYNKIANLANRAGTRGEQQAAKGKAQMIRDRYHMEVANGQVRPKKVKAILTPRNAKEGHLFDSRADAEAVATRLNAEATKVKRGAIGPHKLGGRNTPEDLKFKVVDAGYGQHAVVPEAAAARLHKQQVVGSSIAPGAQYMRVAGRSFRSAVLPLSARWLFGQVGEAGFRSAVAGAGPADLVRFNRVVKQMNKVRPGSGDEFLARVHGGQFDLTGTAREFANGKSLAEELKGTAVEDFARGATRIARAAPLKKIRKAWNGYSRVVFDVINGQIETTARKAMAGQAIRQGPLMQDKLLGLTDRAIHDAAHGLRGTEAQVAAARAVDRMYGQYQKFSPEKREHLLHTTPFYPWYRNTVTFLTQTLPVDHPVKAALVADLDAATEDWRKAHGLSLRQGGGKPGFLLGTYPVGKKGQTVPAGRYLPFAPGQPLQAVGDLLLPQYANVQDILRGRDWKGDDIKAKDVPKEIAKSVVEAHIPGAGQAERIAAAKSIRKGILHELAPFPRTKGKRARKGAGLELPDLELSPLQLQQLQVP